MLDPDRQDQERKDLGLALRKLRKAAGLGGERLAARCGLSQSKISRIERGRTLPSVLDVQRILNALDVPEDVAKSLLDLTRVANVHYKSYRAYAQVGLWQTQRQIKALTESSTVVRQFLPAIPCGLIQTEDYARQVLTPAIPGDISWDVELAVRARMESQSTLLEKSRRFTFLLTEQAVRWPRADRDVMARQCTHMAEISGRPNTDVAVIPNRGRISASPLHFFVIYDERLVTVELFSGSIVLRDPKDISYHLSLFDYFLDHSLTGDDATRFLESMADEFMHGQD
ncbi:helix-turn-helix domain-containing protein [Actinocrispum wychmicini]|uniref:Helix-turn-helix protein n=1 Tax=Actinocrispum wychmicini TaxID=1213861 RepID=A0A4R2JBL0_9PSEU|nr:helix-turn-helix transcriptional regulator [Actinocrispum wychmicini]TCO56873.1 helix-turn-helix protein [Actinocrispum wychmicini]